MQGWKQNGLAFRLRGLVPVHLRVENTIPYDPGDRCRLGLEIGLEQRLVQLFHHGHEGL